MEVYGGLQYISSHPLVARVIMCLELAFASCTSCLVGAALSRALSRLWGSAVFNEHLYEGQWCARLQYCKNIWNLWLAVVVLTCYLSRSSMLELIEQINIDSVHVSFQLFEVLVWANKRRRFLFGCDDFFTMLFHIWLALSLLPKALSPCSLCLILIHQFITIFKCFFGLPAIFLWDLTFCQFSAEGHQRGCYRLGLKVYSLWDQYVIFLLNLLNYTSFVPHLFELTMQGT
jgi:hypothetical protein